MIENTAQFQSELSNYVVTGSPEYWPVWLILAGLCFVGMLGVLILHFMLRASFAKKSVATQEHKVYLYSKAIRLWHWCNALLFIMLLGSGLMNHFGCVSPLAMTSLVAWHKVCGYLLIVCWFGFLVVNLLGGNGHHYCIKTQGWSGRAFKQVKFYTVDIIKGADHPFPATQECKFNPLQQVAYLGVMFGLVPLLILTGVLSLNPEWLLGFKRWILTAHFMLAMIALFFIVGHIYLCTTGRTTTQTFKSMIDGYHRD
ncbi:MAG: thiosulfate reductase cytochrome B subunit [Saezia sp.]